jgi:hypothetical protein
MQKGPYPLAFGTYGNMKLSTSEIAAIIERFLIDKDGPWDWDDFISIRLSNPEGENIRKICANLPERFPPIISGQYCNEEGLKVLRNLIEELRKQ